MFRKKPPKQPKQSYDPNIQRPVIRASICTGEQVAGFKDRNTGKFTEVMLIRDAKDLNIFLESYNILASEVTKEY